MRAGGAPATRHRIPPPAHATDVHYTVFGLGDQSYERWCYAGKMLRRRMESLGATELAESGWGDERAPDG